MIYAGPKIWHIDETGFAYWRAPAKALQWIDLTPPGKEAPGKRAGDLAGIGLFSADESPGRDYIAVENDLSPTAKNLLNLTSSRLDSAFIELMLEATDPTGANAHKPVTPDDRGACRFRLGGLRVSLPATKEMPGFSRVAQVMRIDVERADADVQGKLLASYLAQKLRVAATDEKAEEYLGTQVKVRTPATTIGDTFVQASNTALESHTATGTGGGFSWTQLVGSNTITVRGGLGDCTTNAGNAVYRANSDLSSDNHHTDCDILHFSAGSGSYSGVITRKDSSSTMTYYLHDASDNNNLARLFKSVAATFTQIGSSAAITMANNTWYPIVGQSNGSTISMTFNGSGVLSETDTAITGNVRTGLRGARVTAGDLFWRTFVASDVAAPPAGGWGKLLAGSRNRRVFT
jgi:hypothetical protein